ncbi:MAG: hypothetical protein AAF547_10320 [Actinomycetota bacterium]
MQIRFRRALALGATMLMLLVTVVVTTTGQLDAAANDRQLFEHTGEQKSRTYFQPNVNQPNSYVSPVNYRDGNIYIRMDLTDKPSDILTYAQLCFWRHADGVNFKYETCSGTSGITFRDGGVIYIDAGSPKNWWKKKVDGVPTYDWREQASIIRIMFFDKASRKLLMPDRCGSHCFPGDVTPHIPIKLNAEVIMVAKGNTLTPPSDWRSDCPSSWSNLCQGGNGGGGGGGTTTTTQQQTTTTQQQTTTTQQQTTTTQQQTTTTQQQTTTTQQQTTTTQQQTTTTQQQGNGDTVLLVTNSGRILGKDRPYADAIEKLGYTVQAIADSDVTVSQANAAAGVVISSSVVPSQMTDLTGTTTGMVVSEPFIMDDFDMATKPRQIGNQRDLDIVDSSHPLAAGLDGRERVSNRKTSFNGATPAPSADIIAETTGSGDRATIYAYDTGDAMVGGTVAAGPRVGFYFSYPAASLANNSGDALLEAAIAWAIAG